MKKLTTSVVAIAGFIGTSAFAADMSVKAPPPAPAPVYNWTGLYVGVNAGASMGNVKTDFNVAPVVNNPTAQYPFTPDLGFSDTSAPSGFIGGGQIGYNWQYSPLIVVGLEADFQGALERDTTNNLTQSFSYINPIPPFPGDTIPQGCGEPFFVGSPPPCTSVTSYTTQIDWFGTVRARLGYVWGNGEVLSYITGGLAYGEVKINGTNTVSGIARHCGCDATGPFINGQTFAQSHVNTGWVLGYGTEGRLGISNWTWKVETLYMDLGTLDTASVTSIPWDLGNPGGQVTMHTHFTDWILRGGLNYQFH